MNSTAQITKTGSAFWSLHADLPEALCRVKKLPKSADKNVNVLSRGKSYLLA